MESLVGKHLIWAPNNSDLQDDSSWQDFMKIDVIDGYSFTLSTSKKGVEITLNVLLSPLEISLLSNGSVIHMDLAERKAVALYKENGAMRMIQCVNRGWFKIDDKNRES